MPTADQEWSSRAKLARGRLLENRAFRGPKSGNIVTGAYTSAGKTLDIVLADRLHFGWRGPDAAELRPHVANGPIIWTRGNGS
jgi:hypothetical protein